MKTKLLAFILVFCPTLCVASPFLVCDATTDTVGYYVVEGLPSSMGGANVAIDESKTYGFKLDLSDLPSGTYTVTAKACLEPWGCSKPSSPFTFSRPGIPGAPNGTRLIP